MRRTNKLEIAATFNARMLATIKGGVLKLPAASPRPFIEEGETFPQSSRATLLRELVTGCPRPQCSRPRKKGLLFSRAKGGGSASGMPLIGERLKMGIAPS